MNDDSALPGQPGSKLYFEKIRSGAEQAQAAFQQLQTRHQAVVKPRSKTATILEKWLIRLVSHLYFIEVKIRAILRRPFASKFLRRFQHLTEKTVEQLKGQIAIPLPLPLSQADGTGGLTVAMLLTSAPQEQVKSFLPTELELMPHEALGELQKQVPIGHHPVMIGLGLNSRVGPVWKDRSFVKMKYLELVVGIPGLQLTKEFDEPRGPFFYIPKLLLNALTPTLLGLLFGLKKRLKRVHADEYSYSVASLLLNRPILQAEVSVDPQVEPVFATDIPDLKPWLDFLDQPLVLKHWLWGLEFTFFHWDWFLTKTCPAVVKVQAFSDEVPLVQPGSANFGAQSEPAAAKAYVMSVPWRLLLPFKRQPARGSSPTAPAADSTSEEPQRILTAGAAK